MKKKITNCFYVLYRIQIQNVAYDQIFLFFNFELASLSFCFFFFVRGTLHDTWWSQRRLQSEQRSNLSYHPLVTTETVKALVHSYAYTLYAHFIVVLLAAPLSHFENQLFLLYTLPLCSFEPWRWLGLANLSRETVAIDAAIAPLVFAESRIRAWLVFLIDFFYFPFKHKDSRNQIFGKITRTMQIFSVATTVD